MFSKEDEYDRSIAGAKTTIGRGFRAWNHTSLCRTVGGFGSKHPGELTGTGSTARSRGLRAVWGRGGIWCIKGPVPGFGGRQDSAAMGRVNGKRKLQAKKCHPDGKRQR